jgi:hypothetical protein
MIPDGYRITHHRDLVIHLPILLEGYIHVPTEVFYNHDYS